MRGGAMGVLFAAVLAAPCAPALQAQGGAAVHNQSACAAGRSGATVADPCPDGSAVFYNPAVLAMQPALAGVGSIFIFTDAEFTFDTGETADFDDQFQPVPHLYGSVRPTDRLALALGA